MSVLVYPRIGNLNKMKSSLVQIHPDFKETLSYTALKFITILTAISLFFTVPIFLTLSLPIFLYRIIVEISAKWLRPDLDSIVLARGVMFAIDPMYTKPKNTVVTRLTLDGKMGLDRMRQRLTKTLVNLRLRNCQLRFPELQLFLTQFMGIYFWKKDPDFDIKNHVNLYKKPKEIVYSDSEIGSVMTEMLQKPWAEGKPLWEIIMVQNCNLKGISISEKEDPLGSHTVLFLRVHHVVADGYGIFNMICDGIIGTRFVQPNPVFHERPVLLKLSFGILFPFRCAYELAESFLVPLIPWISLPFSSKIEKQTGEFFLETSAKFPLAKIKETTRHFNVSFSSVLAAASTGALKDMMLRKRIPIPPKFQLVIPMPLPGHPGTLTNYLGFGMIELPLRETDPVKRLQFCSEQYEGLKESAFLALSKYYLQGLGFYIPAITRVLTKHSSSLNMLTNFPGGDSVLSVIDGHDLLDCIFIEGPIGNSALVLCAISFIDGLRISSIADSSLMTKDEVGELTALIYSHLELLYERIAT